MARILVVGSLNLDTTAFVDRLPVPGETVLGTSHFSDTGGKGANQAVAAARLRGIDTDVALVGRVGSDSAGEGLLAILDAEGVDRKSVTIDSEVPTGAAFITVDAAGENMIVVSPGANGRVQPEDLALAGVEVSAVVLAQLEVPMPVIARAAELSTGMFILNPAPGAVLPAKLLEQTDILVPNRTELAVLTGLPVPESIEDVRACVEVVDVDRIVVTLGADGALVAQNGVYTHIPAPEIEVLDPTAAGDAFCGALAVKLSEGADLIAACEWAVLAGAITATRPGAQSALPKREEV